MAQWEDYLKTIYYDPRHPASFAGPQKLYKVVQQEGKYKIGMHRIRQFLHNQDVYSLHKPVRRRFQRYHVISAGMDDLWMADLIEAFSDIFKTTRRSPDKLMTDKGQEFRARKVQALMKQNNIRYFPTQNETKASTSERAILTINMRLQRWFTYNQDYAYLPALQQFADSYNRTFHRTIGMPPASVNHNDEMEVRLSTYFAQQKKGVNSSLRLKPFKYKVGDYVRITHLRQTFTRAYDETYSGEVFRVHKRYHRGVLPIYRLRDLQNEDIQGTFYKSKLQKVALDLDQVWKVDKVLKTKGKGQNKQQLGKSQ